MCVIRAQWDYYQYLMNAKETCKSALLKVITFELPDTAGGLAGLSNIDEDGISLISTPCVNIDV